MQVAASCSDRSALLQLLLRRRNSRALALQEPLARASARARGSCMPAAPARAGPMGGKRQALRRGALRGRYLFSEGEGWVGYRLA